MRLGILARMANLLSFLCVFLLFLPGTTFTEYGKILFLRILQDFELFLGVCIMRGAAISPWERLPFTLQLSQWIRPEHFTCFLFNDVIIYLNCCVPNFPLNYKLLPFSNCFVMNLKLQNAAQGAYLCWLWGLYVFMAMVGGGGVRCLERGNVFKIIGNGGFVFQMQ